MYPHSYFGRNRLVFLSLQDGLRCKIFKTKEFPAKSSRIRSYETFQPLPAEKRRKKDLPGRFAGMLLRMIVRREGEIICKDWPSRQTRFAPEGSWCLTLPQGTREGGHPIFFDRLRVGTRRVVM